MTPQQAGILRHYASLNIMTDDVSALFRTVADEGDLSLLASIPEDALPVVEDFRPLSGRFVGVDLGEQIVPGFFVGSPENVPWRVFSGLWDEIWNMLRAGDLQGIVDLQVHASSGKMDENTVISLLDNGVIMVMCALTQEREGD